MARADWFDRLVADLRRVPYVPEREIDRYVYATKARVANPLSVFPPFPLPLTAQETRLLELMSHGHTLKTAAVELGKGYETAREQMKDARTKLSAATVAEACSNALRQGLIQ